MIVQFPHVVSVQGFTKSQVMCSVAASAGILQCHLHDKYQCTDLHPHCEGHPHIQLLLHFLSAQGSAQAIVPRLQALLSQHLQPFLTAETRVPIPPLCER